MPTPRLTVFSAKSYDRAGLDLAADGVVELTYLDTRLTTDTAALAAGADAVCAFVNDDLGAEVLSTLADLGVRLVTLRCAGYNNVDLERARELGIAVTHVPVYSPNAVAEHTLALMLALNRNIHRAHSRVRDGNFALDGLVGFDMADKCAVVVGTGRIGAIVARLLWHLRCRVIAVDGVENEHLVELGVEYGPLDEALAQADIVTLNCPLTDETRHLINADALAQMPRGVMIVNTGRGALIDTDAVITGLKSGHVASLALDVYEEEGDLFFEDRSQELLLDDTFARLLTFPNVLITAHQAFLTREALDAIASTTIENVTATLAGSGTAHTL